MTEPRPKKRRGPQAAASKVAEARGGEAGMAVDWISDARRFDAACDARRRFDAVIDAYLEECYRNRTVARVSELAARIGLSRQRLVEMVSRAYGKTLAEILRDRQLEYAIDLLTGTSLRMSEVAAASAFGDRSTLYRAFIRKYGMPPFRFRHLDNMQRSEVLQAR